MECGITEEEEDDRFESANFKLAGKYPISPALPAVGRAGRPDAFPLPIRISIFGIRNPSHIRGRGDFSRPLEREAKASPTQRPRKSEALPELGFLDCIQVQIVVT